MTTPETLANALRGLIWLDERLELVLKMGDDDVGSPLQDSEYLAEVKERLHDLMSALWPLDDDAVEETCALVGAGYFDPEADDWGDATARTAIDDVSELIYGDRDSIKHRVILHVVATRRDEVMEEQKASA